MRQGKIWNCKHFVERITECWWTWSYCLVKLLLADIHTSNIQTKYLLLSKVSNDNRNNSVFIEIQNFHHLLESTGILSFVFMKTTRISDYTYLELVWSREIHLQVISYDQLTSKYTGRRFHNDNCTLHSADVVQKLLIFLELTSTAKKCCSHRRINR